jgi:hypothetical protein
MGAKQIETLNGGRFISHHEGNITVYYDGRNKVIKASFGGGFMELLLEYQPDGSSRRQLLVTNMECVKQIVDYVQPD